MTFGEWFKKEYPMYDREGRDESFKAALRKAWNAAANECLRAVRRAPGDKTP